MGRGLVSQLLAAEKGTGYIYDTIAKEHDQSEAERVGTSQTWSLLRQLSQIQTTYLVIDGFDECIDQNALLTELKTLETNAKIVVFSRAISNIWPRDFTNFTMEIGDRDVAADISALVRNRIDSSSIMSALDPVIRADLEKSLIRKADGMFLWIQLVLEQIDDLATFKEVKEHIERTPTTVSAIYRVILEGFMKFPLIQQSRILKVLRWAIGSRRPLSVREISDAIVLRTSSSRIVDEERILQIERVIHQCDPLLHVHPDTNTVHLCHYSLKEFLFQLTNLEAQQLRLLETDSPEIQSGLSEELGRLSLRYLALEDLPEDWDLLSTPWVLDKFPLLRYATDHWLEHILEAPATTANVEVVNDFLRTTAAATWLKNFIKLRKQQFGSKNAGSVLVKLQAELLSWKAQGSLGGSSAMTPTDVFGDLMMRQYLSLSQKLGPQDSATLEVGLDLCEHHCWAGRTHVAEDLLTSFLKGKPGPDPDDNDPSSIQRLPHWLSLALQKMENGRLMDAEALSRQVFEARKKRLGSSSAETCEAAALLADICTDLGKLIEAEDLHRLALDGFVSSRGELDLDTLREYNNFGNTLRLMGKLGEAATMLKKAHEGRSAHYGPKNQSTLRALDNLGTVLLELGKVDEARKAHQAALDGMQELLGADDVLTARAATNLAAAQAEAGMMEDAVDLSRTAVLTMEKLLGTEHNDTLKAAALLGSILRQSKQDDLAVQVLGRTRGIAEQTLGKTHFIVNTCEKELASVQQPLEKVKNANAYNGKSFKEILEKRDRTHGKAVSLLKHYRTIIIPVVVLLLLFVQWILKARLRRQSALQNVI